MTARRVWAAAITAAALGAMLVGCTGGGRRPAAASAASAAPIPSTGAEPSVGVEPSVGAEPSDLPAPGPPGATLVEIPGGRAVPGILGAWTFDGAGSDGPWLPASALGAAQVTGAGGLELRLAGDVAISGWAVRAAPVDDPAAERAVNLGSRDDGPPVSAVAVASPGPGRWVLAVRVVLADGRGDATWYWLVGR